MNLVKKKYISDTRRLSIRLDLWVEGGAHVREKRSVFRCDPATIYVG